MGIGRVIYDTLAEFGAHTTIGGLCNAGLASSRARQAYWLIIFTVLFGITISSIVSVVQTYLQYGVTTSTDLSYSNQLMFPAITICNLNRVHCENLFEQIYTLRSLRIGLNGTSTSASTLKQLSNRNDQLSDIFNITGCFTQVCNNLQDEIPDVRNASDPNPDNVIMKMSAINCSLDDTHYGQVCYFLMVMNVTYNSTTKPSRSDIVSAWKNFNCSDILACKYANSNSAPAPGCAQYTTTSPSPLPGGGGGGGGGVQTTGRKKRQVQSPGGNPGGIPGGGQGSTTSHSRSPPPVALDFQIEATFLKKYMQLSEEDRAAIGHQLSAYQSSSFGKIDGFLHACTYKGRDCTNETYWFSYYTAKFGNCYTFNSQDNDNDSFVPRQASLTGRDYGVSIELFLDQNNYMLNKLSKNAGAKIVIHDPSLPPLPDEYGIDMQPDTASSIAVQTTNITRAEYPYVSKCIRSWDQTGYGIATNVNYSLAACQRYMLQLDITSICKCFHPNLVQSKINTTMGVPPCLITPNITESSNFFCFSKIIDEYNNNTRNADNCHVVCNELEYSSSVSTSTWPSDQYWVNLALSIEKYKNDDPVELAKNDDAKSEIQTNYAMAEVYFQTLNVVSIQQSPTMDVPGFISALGGSLGLFTGIAIIMIFEFLELMYDLFINIWNYTNSPKNEQKKRYKSAADCSNKSEL